MRLLICLIFVFLLTAIATAQDLDRFEEVTAGNFYGVGAKQMSMGGAGIAASWDGAALYYNPAALARVHRIELQMGINHEKFTNESRQPAGRYQGFNSLKNSASESLTKTRLGSVNVTIPAPTYRGSLVLAFGANRVASFDRISLYNVIDDSSGLLIEDYAKEFESGAIYLYSGGMGVDISPKISLGLALNIYSGSDNFNYDYYFRDEPLDESGSAFTRVTEDYIGVSLKGGMLVRPNEYLSIGATMETPLDYQVEYSYADDYEQYYIEYDLTRPFVFGAGLAFRFSTFTLAADAEYTDWSQLSYNDNAAMELDNDSLALIYQDALNIRLGGEFQIPSAGLALRAGYFSTPLPYNERYINNDRDGITLGFGWLIDGVLMLETAYVRGSFERKYTAPNYDYISYPLQAGKVTAEDTFSRLYLTLSYRY